MMVPRPQPRILLVEAQESVAVPIRALLESNGFRVQIAGDPAEAMTMAEQPFAALIVDLRTDDQPSYTFIEWLKATRAHLLARLIVMSGDEHLPIVAKLEGLGVCGVVPKPVDAEAVLRAVYDCLEKTPTYAVQ